MRALRNVVLAVVCLLGMTVAPMVAAEDALGVNASTLGYGLDWTHKVSDRTAVRLGVNKYDYTYNESEGGTNYAFKLKLLSAHAFVDWSPWDGVFHTTVGALYNKNKIVGDGNDGNGTIGNNVYVNPDLHAEVTFNTFAPYVGIGWGNPVGKDKRFGFSFDLGVVYQGSPKVKLTSSVVAQSDLDIEQHDLEGEISDAKYYPVIGLGMSYKF